MTILILFEIDPGTREATGVVVPFCSEEDPLQDVTDKRTPEPETVQPSGEGENTMQTEKIHSAIGTATLLRAQIQAANAEAAHSNPLAAIMLLDLIGQSVQIEQRLSEIAYALGKTS